MSKKQNEKSFRVIEGKMDSVEKHFENLENNWYKDELRHYAECFEEDNPEEIPTHLLKEHNYKDLRVLGDFFYFWGVLKSYQKDSLKD